MEIPIVEFIIYLKAEAKVASLIGEWTLNHSRKGIAIILGNNSAIGYSECCKKKLSRITDQPSNRGRSKLSPCLPCTQVDSF